MQYISCSHLVSIQYLEVHPEVTLADSTRTASPVEREKQIAIELTLTSSLHPMVPA